MSDPFGAPAPRAVRGKGKGKEYIDSDGIRRDRWDRPLLPDPDTGEIVAWTSVTTLAGTLSDRYALGQWQMRQVARGMGLRHDLAAMASTIDPEADGSKVELDSIAQDAMEAAGASTGRNLGTALHDLIKSFNRADKAGRIDIVRRANPVLAKDLQAYARALEEYGIEPVPDLTERMGICRELGTAGRMDAGYMCPDGMVRVGDAKSGQKANQYGQYELSQQLASYARSDLFWTVTDASTGAGVYEKVPYQVDDLVGLQVWVPAGQGKCEVFLVDLSNGYHEALTAKNVRERRKAASKWVIPMPTLAQHQPAESDPYRNAIVAPAPAPEPGRCEFSDLPPEQCAHCREIPDPAPASGEFGPWITASYAGVCAGCCTDFHEGAAIRADGFGGWWARCCGAPDPAPAPEPEPAGKRALDDLLLQRIRAASMDDLLAFATTPPPGWSEAMQTAAAERWYVLANQAEAC